MHLQPLLFAALDSGVILGLGGAILGTIFGVFVMYFHHRRTVMWHETARIALEKGQPIPEPSPEAKGLLSKAHRNDSPEAASIRRKQAFAMGGMFNIAFGLGGFLALSNLPDGASQSAPFALIPIFMGIASLLGLAVDGIFFSGKKKD